MSYTLINLQPAPRGNSSPQRVVVGGRNIWAGRSITVEDAFVDANLPEITEKVAAGVVSLTYDGTGVRVVLTRPPTPLPHQPQPTAPVSPEKFVREILAEPSLLDTPPKALTPIEIKSGEPSLKTEPLIQLVTEPQAAEAPLEHTNVPVNGSENAQPVPDTAEAQAAAAIEPVPPTKDEIRAANLPELVAWAKQFAPDIAHLKKKKELKEALQLRLHTEA